jgi:hypothetical protein
LEFTCAGDVMTIDKLLLYFSKLRSTIFKQKKHSNEFAKTLADTLIEIGEKMTPLPGDFPFFSSSVGDHLQGLLRRLSADLSVCISTE